MIGHLERNGVPGRDRPQRHQELGDVLDLGDEPSRFVVRLRREDVGVVLEHRAAAGGVDDDRVDLGRVETPPGFAAPGRGPAARRPSGSGSRRSRPGRAGSRPRSRFPGARAPWPRWSRETWRRPRSRGTSATRARFGPDRRQDLGQTAVRPAELRAASPACAAGSAAAGGQSPIRSAQSSKPSRCSSRAGASASLTRPE